MKKIESTKNYKQFKKLIGNRDVEEYRINKIITSIKKVGYITSPIIVNENMEVIDGQGRLEALKRMKLPVEYIIHEGIGIDECVSMNINQSNWKLIDYINSFAARGYESYKKLKSLIELYPNFPINVIAVAVRNQCTFQQKIIAAGHLDISEEEYNTAIVKLNKLQEILPIVQNIDCQLDILLKGILFCYSMDEVEEERLIESFEKNQIRFKQFHTIAECMQMIEDIYNYGKGKRVYIYTLYRIMIRENGKRGYKKAIELKLKGKEKKDEEVIIDSKEAMEKALEEIRQY